ncbi:MAG: hypothetical protein R6U88_05415 [Candidatus Bipolaricaulota bacterium]
MYTVSQLVEILNLQTENQVRNRLQALRDQLVGHLRRGPNNQLLVTETGLELLRSLQGLCETGYTLRDAASLVRYDEDTQDTAFRPGAPYTGPNHTEPALDSAHSSTGWPVFVQHLAEQVRSLEARVAALEAKSVAPSGHAPWWENWR